MSWATCGASRHIALAWAWRSLAPFPRLSPTDSDCGTERSEARAGGQRSRGHAQRSEVKRSEPDGVRPNLRRAVGDFQQSEAAAENHSLPPGFPFVFLMEIKKLAGFPPPAG